MWEIYGMHRKYAVGGKVQSQEGYKTARPFTYPHHEQKKESQKSSASGIPT